MTGTKQEFLDRMDELRETFTPGYLAMLAICLTIADGHNAQLPAKYSRGDCKRGIRVLRELQKSVRNPMEVEDAISLIRREWLHRREHEDHH